MPNFSRILYPDSPFSPRVNQYHLDNITEMFKTKKHSLLFCLSHELCEIGINQNKLHSEELDWLKNTFQTGPAEILDFFLGFTTPPLLMMGVELLKQTSIRIAIQSICKSTTDPLRLKLNQYKSNLLMPLYYRIADIPTTQITKKLIVTMEICEEKPFSPNFYYLAGQASYLRTGLSLIPSLPQ